jgi:ribonuclease
MRNNTVYKLMIVLLLIIIAVRFIKSSSQKGNSPAPQNKEYPTVKNIHPETNKQDQQNTSEQKGSIDELTKESVVVAYVKQHNRLPDYYIKKKEARKFGWDPAAGNLCEVLPGRAIGGDFFTNREGRLPEKPGRNWFEADLNYDCAHRNADRLLFSNDGLVYLTKDHYKTFIQQ